MTRQAGTRKFISARLFPATERKARTYFAEESEVRLKYVPRPITVTSHIEPIEDPYLCRYWDR